jgi:hypothetical protein
LPEHQHLNVTLLRATRRPEILYDQTLTLAQEEFINDFEFLEEAAW